MASQKISVLLPSLLGVVLVSIVSFCEASGNRCLFTHRDPPCDVTGIIPLQLTCSYPGKWFTLKAVNKRTNQGIWQQVSAAKGAFEKDCKKSRTVQKGANGLESAICNISSHPPGIGFSEGVKVEYYCWEIDPDLLGGFGKRSHIRLNSEIFRRTKEN
ncbi:uncharacterized protein LOC111323077 [Stylophora pistillata]|uniref:MD-2-related lipid-recognition domain-containing protein n=1 Tax=Stylophora pistillata TaxID=50429 RepID=A0A2B4SLI7_STYPI|nr:uncharacterized protein LOC111323077 [Stylophora pistillata]PFX30761.1 hypothetical protein AWC38_SpisGene4380 [Stylophora pistillata]